jgi:hypothetical protein
MGHVEQKRRSLCPSLIPGDCGCGEGLLGHHKKDGADVRILDTFSIQAHKFPPLREVMEHVKDTITTLKMNLAPDKANSHHSSGTQLKICSPFVLSLFVALEPTKKDDIWALTPCQPAVHSRRGLLSQDLLTPRTNNMAYIEHVAAGGEAEGDLFSNPIETILYSVDSSQGATIYPMEILESNRYQQTGNKNRADHIKLEHVKDAFTLLVGDQAALSDCLPLCLKDKTDEPVVLFLGLLAAIHKKYEGLASDRDWLAMLSNISGHGEPQAELSISTVSDLHFTTRVAFAEKVLCKIAVTKGLRKILLTYHISHSEWPPDTLEQILNPRSLQVAGTAIFSVPCPISVAATKGGVTTFENMLSVERTKRMEEAWMISQRARTSTVQDFLLERIADMPSMHNQGVSEQNQTTGFLTSAKGLCNSLSKKEQVDLHQRMRQTTAKLLLEVHAGKRNVQLCRIIERYRDNLVSCTAASETAWEVALEESLSKNKNSLKMTSTNGSSWKGGKTLNLLVAILTQSVYLVESTDGGQRLENDEILFQVIRRNGRGRHHHTLNTFVSTHLATKKIILFSGSNRPAGDSSTFHSLISKGASNADRCYEWTRAQYLAGMDLRT